MLTKKSPFGVKDQSIAKGIRYHFDVPLLSFEDEAVHHVYAPALDLFGYGSSPEEAKSSFDITLAEFFRYTTSKKTLLTELQQLGWKISKRKPISLSIPTAEGLKMHRAAFEKDIMRHKPSQTHTTIQIPALV